MEAAMLVTEEIIDKFEDFHEVLGYQPEDSLFFDIETTGLSHTAASVFLIGTIARETDRWVLTQYLAEKNDEEELLLRRFFADAAPFQTLIHFNGTAFDLPFLLARARQFQIPVTGIDADGHWKKHSLDLYQQFRPLKTPLKLKRVNQLSLECAAGWHREDTLTGKQMTALFHGFAKTEDPEIRRLLLLHNHDDLLGMTKILSLAAYRLLFAPEAVRTCSVSVQGPTPEVLSGFPRPEVPSKDTPWQLRISFALSHPVPGTLLTENPFSLSITGADGLLTLPCFHGELRFFFPDYKNYAYLPLENQAVHKSVAACVDADYRIPATPETCFVRRTALFCMQPKGFRTPAFRERYDSAKSYFEYDPSLPMDQPTLTRLICLALDESFPALAKLWKRT